MTAMVLTPAERDPFKIAMAVRQLTEGRSNAVGTLTLAAGATTTVVKAPNCGPDSAVFLFQQTANAAAAWATTFVGPTDVKPGQFTVHHANAGTTDRRFWFVCLG